jgi:hypothetical protein
MPKIIEPPKPKRATCKACSAVIEYLPEDVKTETWYSMGEYDSTTYSVKCPREKCPGTARVPAPNV